MAQLFRDPGSGARALPALALTADVAVLTALTNDVGFEVVFARPLAAFAPPATSRSGCRPAAGRPMCSAGFEEARRRGRVTVGFAGYVGGRMAAADTIEHLFVVPSPSVHRIQEVQTTTYHVLWELTQQALG